MNVLVAYASRHGSTTGIAERISARLHAAGFETTCSSVGEVGSLKTYDAFVIGSAAYMFHWLKEATRFVKRNRKVLAQRPVWLFSSGPLGTELVDDKGQDVFSAARPKEFEELEPLIDIHGDRVFFGARDADVKPKGMAEQLMRFMPAARDALPTGDFRDWDAIEAWADEIGDELRTMNAAT